MANKRYAPEYKSCFNDCGYIAAPQKDEIYFDAINHYGSAAQTAKAVEELAELQQALCKYLCGVSYDMGNIIEEIADVEIMLQQIRMIFNIDEKAVENIKYYKISRLNERLKSDDKQR